ncbi:MAG: 2-amino-4-hydroxy-6-hydroxymethyldihydropteridine diphosphokinase [Candidatus Tokpelaia sp. JSC188]|nr:MAG: 2-amino-4-hydroxy-6-hydroxymethyldihydropteridine diphosphokinase [Candidatus Tokpelaia sp. JSC188]
MKRKKRFRAWIGLGGNLGNIMNAMAYALQCFDKHDDCSTITVSSVYKTPPWGKKDQPWFLNACAKISTGLAPEALLQLGLDIENEMERSRVEKWGPRTLDIDLLFYEDLKISISSRLLLPHPEIGRRAFVLIPLAEISPKLIFKGETIANLAEQFENKQIIKCPTGRLWWKGKFLNIFNTTQEI